MSAALDRLQADLKNGAVWHCGDPRMMAHLVNTVVSRRGALTLVKKPSHERKIDSTVGWTLAHEARADALEADAKKKRPRTGRAIGF